MNERRSARRGPVTTLRVVGGVVAVLAPFVLGILGHSPWKVLLLVPAFAASYLIGRAAGPDRRPAVKGIGSAISIVFVQLALVGLLYLFGLGLGALLGDVLPLEPLAAGDLLFVAIVWAVTLGCATAGLLIARHRAPPAPLGRS